MAFLTLGATEWFHLHRLAKKKMSVTLKHVFKAMDGKRGTRLLRCEYTELELHSPTVSQGIT